MSRVVFGLAMLLLATITAAATDDSPAFLPFGVYDKAEIEPGTPAWREYYDTLFVRLAGGRINTLVILPYRDVRHTLAIMDRARAANVRVVMSVGNPLNPAWDYVGPDRSFYRAYKHPSVIAYKYGDEPDEDGELKVLSAAYAALRRYSRLPILTAMVGEHMDFAPSQFASHAWTVLRADVRFARHYPLRRTFDLIDWSRDKMQLPLQDWARQMELHDTTPWWFVVQTFGQGTELDARAYWRLPTSAELVAMVHVALANGAHGVIGYAFQDHDGGKLLGLLDASLRPRRARDGSIPFDAFAELATLVQTHAPLLLRLKRASFAVSVSTRSVLAVPRMDRVSGEQFVYVVNLDSRTATSAAVRTEVSGRVATNLYVADSARAIARRDDGAFIAELAPGEGQLWRLGR